jgi:hypothetical protein
VTAPANETDNAFIKYVWATEKVGELLAEMGRGGDQNRLIEEITKLGVGYSIQTPYTSFSTPSAGGGGGGSSGGGGFAGADGGAAGCSCGLAGAAGCWPALALGLLAALGLLLRRRG